MCDPVNTSVNPEDTSLMSLKRNIQWCALWDYRGAEVLNMMVSIAFGIWLFVPTWQAFHRCPEIYYVMEAMGEFVFPRDPEMIWGMAFMTMGIFKILILWRDHTRSRKWSALVSGMLWTTVTCTVGFSDARAPMFPIYFLLAFNMYRVFFCIKVK